MFDQIATEYDRFNAWASLGLHQHWRKLLVRRIPSGARVLDIATGTGDIAFLASQAGHAVIGLDFSDRMLEQARVKDREKRIRWMNGSADKLPFSDRSFGCVTSAFALRNVRGSLASVFRENARVLRNGGKVLHMDFGRPSSAVSRLGHKVHLNFGVPLIGQILCKERWPKGYLENTIMEFHEPEKVCAMLEEAGFSQVKHTSVSWGVVQLFEGIKC
jgi:demethylmenaquinone methyltransferase / 2-methoxy-6-polyprenyl-1,4-benzoquinol methylase